MKTKRKFSPGKPCTTCKRIRAALRRVIFPKVKKS